MTDERVLLAAIAADPVDRTARLVYADWLDDHVDPRAELVRIEEEQRTLPATADRYWALKPRRNELRAACAADWLAAMGYGTSYRPVLAPWPTADARGRFRLLREFVERWYGVPVPDVGGHDDEVTEAERRVGRPLPVAVREWVAFASEVVEISGRAPEVFRDGFEPSVVEFNPRLGLVVAELSEGDNLWLVPADRLADPDPAVEHYCLQAGDFRPDGGYDPPAGHPMGTATEFAFAFLMDGLNGGYGSPLHFRGEGDGLAAAEGCFAARVRVGTIDVFEGDDVLVLYGSGYESSPGDRSFSVRIRSRPIDPAVERWIALLD